MRIKIRHKHPKQKIAEICMKGGMDFMTAYEEATEALERFHASGRDKMDFDIRNTRIGFTLTKG